MIDSLLDKYRDSLVLEDIEARLVRVQCKSLNTNTSIAAEKIFDVAAASPRVIAANITVVRAEHGPPSLVLCTMSTSEGLGANSVLVNA